jgi:hypothetical protein
MAAATKDIPRVYGAGIEPIFNDYALEAGITAYEGAVVTIDPTNDTVGAFAAADDFVGFAITKAVEGTQTHVKVRSRGLVRLTTDGTPSVGDAVYASDNSTFSQTGTGILLVGTVHRVVDATAKTVMVYFEAESLRSV